MDKKDIMLALEKLTALIKHNAQILTVLTIFAIGYVMVNIFYSFGQRKTDEWFTRGLKYAHLSNALDSTDNLPLNDYRGRLYKIPVKRAGKVVHTFVGLNLPSTTNCKIKRLFEQLTDISFQAHNHLQTAREFMVQSYLSITMSSIFYTISIALLIFVTKSGWSSTNPLIITILISTSAVGSFFFGLTHIFNQEENANKNLALYLEHINLEQEMRSVLAKEPCVYRNMSINCLNGEAWADTNDIQKTDSLIFYFNDRIKQLNKIELGFNAAGVLQLREEVGGMKIGK